MSPNQNAQKEVNLSNEWRIYAKMECNYHLTNKYALFVNMSKYYTSIGKDPLDVLPLSFHIKKGSTDPNFFKFMQVFREYEEKAKAQIGSQKNSVSNPKKDLDNSDVISGEKVLSHADEKEIGSPLSPKTKRTTPMEIKQNPSNTSLLGDKEALCRRCKGKNSELDVRPQNQGNQETPLLAPLLKQNEKGSQSNNNL